VNGSTIATLLEEASKLHEKGELLQAKERYETILAHAPEQPDALHQLGLVYVGLDEMTQAISVLKKAVAILPQSLIFRNNLANALVAVHLYDEAIEHYQVAVKNNPQYAQAYNNIGTVYYKKKDLEQAESYFKLALSYLPNYSDAHYNLGLCYVKNNEVEKAVAEFIEVLTEQPHHIQAHHQLANCFFILKQFDYAAREYLLVLQAQEDNVEVIYNLANAYFLQSQFQLATNYFEHVLDLDPDYIDAIFNLGAIYFLQYDYDKAINYFEQVLTRDQAYIKAYYNLGIIYAKLNKYEQAADYYQKVLEIDPSDEAVRYLLAAIKNDPTIQAAPADYITSLFDFYANHFDQELTQNLAYQVPQLLAMVAKPYLSENAGTYKILDLGCGTGLSGEAFRLYAQTLVGVDLSRNMLIKAQAKEVYDQLILGDFREALLQFKEAIDVVVAADTFVYLGDLAETLQRSALALSNHGLLVFNTEKSEGKAYQLLPSGRFAHTKEYIERISAQAQLTIVRVQEDILRTQSGIPVTGYLWLLRK
jgi:predicted TPR repeat methyltransferase